MYYVSTKCNRYLIPLFMSGTFCWLESSSIVFNHHILKIYFNLVFGQENAVIRWALSDVQAICVGASCISENTRHTLIKC